MEKLRSKLIKNSFRAVVAVLSFYEFLQMTSFYGFGFVSIFVCIIFAASHVLSLARIHSGIYPFAMTCLPHALFWMGSAFLYSISSQDFSLTSLLSAPLFALMLMSGAKSMVLTSLVFLCVAEIVAVKFKWW